MSFVERSIILCPYLGGSTIGGSTVYSVDRVQLNWLYNLNCLKSRIIVEALFLTRACHSL